jgi:molecular chaperone DnaK
MPQIEVTFDIDANGILNVSAKDKATGKAQSIVIKASSGLSDDEVETMIKDAKSHSEEDKKFKEMAELRNQADGLIHGCEKSIKDLAAEMSEDEKKGIETAISELKEAIQGTDKAQIEDRLKVLSDASAKLSERVYAKKSAEGQAQQADSAQHESTKPTEESVVDAEFEEVKEDKK